MLQLAHLVERVTRNTGRKRLTSVLVLDVAELFSTMLVRLLL
jgi:hypothetical protein